MDLFISGADQLFGPITTLRGAKGRVTRHIPWTAFHLNKADWKRVSDVRDILKVCVSLLLLDITVLTHQSGLKQHSTKLFVREATYVMACSARDRRVTDDLGEEV